MTVPLAVFTTLYAAMLGCWALVSAALQRAPTLPLVGGTVLLELTLLTQGAVDAVTLVAGHDPENLPTHLGYLLVSVLVLPALVLITRPTSAPAGDRLPPTEQRWTSAVLAIACCAIVVIVIRLWSTWQP